MYVYNYICYVYMHTDLQYSDSRLGFEFGLESVFSGLGLGLGLGLGYKGLELWLGLGTIELGLGRFGTRTSSNNNYYFILVY